MGFGRLNLAAPFAVALLIASCGVNREVEKTQSSPNAVVTIDHTVAFEVGPFQGSTLEGVKSLAPTSVTADVQVRKGPDGYLFRISWEFQGREPEYWEIQRFGDLDDGRDDDSTYQGTWFAKKGEKREFTSPPLSKNRLFKFVLIAQIHDFSSGTTTDGRVTFKTVRVNLKGLP